MKGTRITDGSDPINWPEGAYGLFNGEWFAKPTPYKDPGRKLIGGCTAALGKHDVIEHEDGTITVSPSILVSTTRGPNREYVELYHGYLERGVWRSV